jgi:hypothetical protein
MTPLRTKIYPVNTPRQTARRCDPSWTAGPPPASCSVAASGLLLSAASDEDVLVEVFLHQVDQFGTIDELDLATESVGKYPSIRGEARRSDEDPAACLLVFHGSPEFAYVLDPDRHRILLRLDDGQAACDRGGVEDDGVDAVVLTCLSGPTLHARRGFEELSDKVLELRRCQRHQIVSMVQSRYDVHALGEGIPGAIEVDQRADCFHLEGVIGDEGLEVSQTLVRVNPVQHEFRELLTIDLLRVSRHG